MGTRHAQVAGNVKAHVKALLEAESDLEKLRTKVEGLPAGTTGLHTKLAVWINPVGDEFAAILDAWLSLVESFVGELSSKTDVLESVHVEVSSRVDGVGFEERAAALDGGDIFSEEGWRQRRVGRGRAARVVFDGHRCHF